MTDVVVPATVIVKGLDAKVTASIWFGSYESKMVFLHADFVFQQTQVVLDLSLPKPLKTKVEVQIMLKMSEVKCLRLDLDILAYNTLEKVPMEW